MGKGINCVPIAVPVVDGGYRRYNARHAELCCDVLCQEIKPWSTVGRSNMKVLLFTGYLHRPFGCQQPS